MGSTKLTVRVLDAPGATADMRAQPAGTCFDKARNYTRGNCDAARFAVTAESHADLLVLEPEVERILERLEEKL